MVEQRAGMVHPLVTQLRFTRSELRRGLAGLSEDDARRRIGPANSISWTVGHLAWQEQRYWLTRMSGLDPIEPRLNEEFCYGCPAHTPGLAEMWHIWERVKDASDPILDALTTDDLEQVRWFEDVDFTAGNLMNRVIYHYWYHLGEALGLRQAMGHTNLPEFVGNIDDEAPFVRF
jgi:hypothetical protein